MMLLKGLQNSKKVWAGRKLLLQACTFSAALAVFSVSGWNDAAAVTAPKLDPHKQQMTYEVFAGGFNAVQAHLDIDYTAKNRYSMELTAVTKGLLGKLVPWEGAFITQGWRAGDGKERPELHKSTAEFDGETDVKEYKYGKDGSFKSLTIIENGKDRTPESLDDKLVQGTTDALTASLHVMKAVAEKGICEGEDEVFDGKRRFKMIFRQKAEDELSLTKYNVYEGSAIRCEVEVQPLSGDWHKKPRGWLSIQEQGRVKGSLPTVWLAQVSEGKPAVPVKLRVKTDYGTLFMHMTDYKSGDVDKAAEAASSN